MVVNYGREGTAARPITIPIIINIIYHDAPRRKNEGRKRRKERERRRSEKREEENKKK